MQSSAKMHLTRGTSLSDKPQNPNIITAGVKKPAQSAVLWRSETSTPDLVASKQEAKPLGFGAFRTFEERAQSARTLAMQVAPEQLRTKSLSDALDTWWTHVKEPSVKKPRTKESYLLYMKHLKRKLGTVELCKIDIGFVLEYQRERHKVEGASIWLVNHETNTLSQVMRYADLWDRIEKYFRQLPPPDWTAKGWTVEEEDCL